MSITPSVPPPSADVSLTLVGPARVPPDFVEIPGYALLEELGRGGMGVVYKARQLSLDRVVAVKLIHLGPQDADRYHRFRLEAETIARLKNPGIIGIHEVGATGGVAYCVLEYAAGGSLDRLLVSGPPPVREAAGLVAKVARAVQAAHDAGVVHRDLKPANILLSASGEPLVGDFGLAKTAAGDGLTAAGQVLGTPSYMSPEQASGDSRLVGPASDVYALGAVLYACLANRAPFASGSVAETLAAVRNRPPVPVRKHNRDVPRDLDTVVGKCLEKEPHRRYPSAAALADDLDRFLRGEPIRARRTTPLERLYLAALRRPAVAAAWLFGSLAAAVLAVAVALAWAYREASAARAGEERQRRAAEASAGRLARLLDTNHVVVALRSSASGDVAGGRAALGEVEAGGRGWAWHLADRVLHAPAEYRDDRGGVSDLLFNADGSKLFVAGGGEAIRAHDGETLAVAAVAAGPMERGPVLGRFAFPQGLAARADFREVVATRAGSELLFLDPTSGAVRRRTALRPGWLSTLGLHPYLPHAVGGTRGIPVSGTGVLVFDAGDGSVRKLLAGHTRTVTAAAYSPDGSRLVSASDDGTARLWSVPDYAAGPVLRLHAKGVSAVAFRPDGGLLATGGADGAVGLWKMPEGDLSEVVPVAAPVTALKWSPDGSALAIGQEGGAVAVRRAAGFSLVLRANTERGSAARALAFRGDGLVLATGADDGTVRLHDAGRPPQTSDRRALPAWTRFVGEDPATGEVLAQDVKNTLFRLRRAGAGWKTEAAYVTNDHLSQVVAHAGSGFVVAAGRRVAVFDRDTARRLHTIGDDARRPASVTMAADGNSVVEVWSAGEGRSEMVRRDLRTGEALVRLGGLPDYPRPSPDGALVAFAGGVRRLPGGALWADPDSKLTPEAWSADGSTVAYCDSDHCVVRRSADGVVVWRGRLERRFGVALSGDGGLLFHSPYGGGIEVRELPAGLPVTLDPDAPTARRLWWDARRGLLTAWSLGAEVLTTYAAERATLPPRR